MRIAVFSDVHGNGFALQAVAGDIERARPDLWVNLGDQLFGSADPAGAWRVQQQLRARFRVHEIRGNTDEVLGGRSPAKPEQRELCEWLREQLPDGTGDTVAALPTCLNLAEGEVMAAHGTPTDPWTYLLRNKKPERWSADSTVKKRLGEVYFHRAYLHYLLVRMYGEAVYVDRVIQATDDKNFKKESVHSLIRKIKQDCDSAYALVPARWSGVDFGRVDKGATLGLKAIVSWIAATPLYNGGTLPNDTREFKSEYGKDASRWATSREDLARMWAATSDEDLAAATPKAISASAAKQATFWAGRATAAGRTTLAAAYSQLANTATKPGEGARASDVAVVTGGSPGSIAAAVIGGLLADGSLLADGRRRGR